MKLKTGNEADSSLHWTVFTHSQSIDREPNLFFKSYIIKDVFKSMQFIRIKDYLNKKRNESDEDAVNESRIKVLQHSGSPQKRQQTSQTHRQVP